MMSLSSAGYGSRRLQSETCIGGIINLWKTRAADMEMGCDWREPGRERQFAIAVKLVRAGRT